ncbi:hypothetical protein AbraIFM66950_005149 [Aspergillus brasiliensis]|nr:hypothetical protein AbraIFM66950_005149 [Aspergillus brasiliensis]
MERRGPTPGSGSYGKACRQCSKAKCRCVARPDGVGCERCLRLKKQCQPSDSTRRKPRRNPESGAQMAKLEGRIDSLTAMLQSVAHATGSTTTPSPSNGSSQPYAPPPPLYELNLDEAARYLNRFTTHMLPCFPFICLPADTTIQQLHQERPFLLEAIIAVATPSTQAKLARADRLKSRLTQSAMLENQSSIDMLLSILTYIAWSTDPFVKRASNLSRMIMLAMSIVYDLQLDKQPPPPPEAPVIAKMTPGLGNPDPQPSSDNSLQGILEQHRAVLACFVLSSIISSTFRRTVPLPWNSQLEQALNLIKISKEIPSDEYLATQIRLQILAQKALSLREPEETEPASTSTTTTPPATTMYLKVLQKQLNDLQSSISPHLPYQDLLHLQTHYTTLLLHEIPRLTSSSTPLLPPSTITTATSTTTPSPLTNLWHSLQAIKAWLSTFQTLPAATITGFPFFMWFQLVRCVVLLKHLSTFEDPAWDCDAVRQEVDMLDLLEWMGEKAEMASMEAGEGEGDDNDDGLFRRVGRMLRLSREWVVRKQRGEIDGDGLGSGVGNSEGSVEVSIGSSGTGDGDGGSGVMGVDVGMDMTDMMWMHALESGDGGWLEEVLGWSPLAV